MTDDSGATPQDEVKASEVSESTGDNLPTSVIPSGATAEATQTMASEISASDLSTVTSPPLAEVAPAGAFAPTAQAPMYEQFGVASATVQPLPYAGTSPVTPTGAQIQPQAADLAALSAQGTFAPYSGQPGQFYANQPGVPVPARKKRRPLL